MAQSESDSCVFPEDIVTVSFAIAGKTIIDTDSLRRPLNLSCAVPFRILPECHIIPPVSYEISEYGNLIPEISVHIQTDLNVVSYHKTKNPKKSKPVKNL